MVQTIFLYLCKHCLFNLTSYIKYIQNTMARLPFQAIVYHFYEFIISSFIFLIYIYKNTDVFYEDTKTHFLQVKKVVFVSQKGSFCTPKTILLQRKNHTFTRRICNTQITNTLRTLRECVSNGLQMCPQRFTNVWRTRIHGHDKSTPTAANSLPFRCERIVNNATNTHEITTKYSVNTQHSPTK